MSDIKIEKITIKMGEQEAELTLEQARELQAALSGLLGIKQEKETVYIDRPYSSPYIVPYVPYDYDRWRYVKVDWEWQPYTVPRGIWSGTTTSGSTARNYTITIS